MGSGGHPSFNNFQDLVEHQDSEHFWHGTVSML